jgi:hypothetical protein
MWWKAPASWGAYDVLSFLATVCLIAAAALCVVCIHPRLPGSKRGLVYFAAVAEFSGAADYAAAIGTSPTAQLLAAKAMHAYELARVCRAKYMVLALGLWIGAVGTFAAPPPYRDRLSTRARPSALTSRPSIATTKHWSPVRGRRREKADQSRPADRQRDGGTNAY